MKNLWTLFVLGIFGAALLSFVIRDTNAQDNSKDARVKKIDDPAISSVRTQVPLVKEMDLGLAQRETEIQEREKRVKESEDRLALEESRVKERIDELQNLLDDLAKKQAESRKTSEATLNKLVKTYETMDPKKASGVISVMNDDLAVELITAMKEKKVAAILDLMDANRAMTLSSLIAKRRPAGKAIGEEQAQH